MRACVFFRGIVVLAAFALLAGCTEQRTPPRYVVARPQTADAQVWEIRYDSTWVPVSIDGISPPSYLMPPILSAPNAFIFVGYIDSSGTDSLGFSLRAWNIYPPIRRQLIPGAPPDSTANQMISREDFPSLHRYQSWSYTAAATFWPPLWEIKAAPRGFSAGAWR